MRRCSNCNKILLTNDDCWYAENINEEYYCYDENMACLINDFTKANISKEEILEYIENGDLFYTKTH